MKNNILNTALPLIYFGKIPSRGDFIRSSNNILMDTFDNWISLVLKNLSYNNPAQWKNDYDSLKPVNFAFFGKSSKHVLIGSMIKSYDSSGRRFPFLCGISQKISSVPVSFEWLPLYFSDVWQATQSWLSDFISGQHSNQQQLAHIIEADPNEKILNSNNTYINVKNNYDADKNSYTEFLQKIDLLKFAESLDGKFSTFKLKQRILATLMLIEPLSDLDSFQNINKGLHFPVSNSKISTFKYQLQFWYDMLLPFFKKRTNEELSIFQYQNSITAEHELGFNFDNKSDEMLYSILSNNSNEYLIDFKNTDWVNNNILNYPNFVKLSSYLDNDDLKLTHLRNSLFENFNNRA